MTNYELMERFYGDLAKVIPYWSYFGYHTQWQGTQSFTIIEAIIDKNPPLPYGYCCEPVYYKGKELELVDIFKRWTSTLSKTELYKKLQIEYRLKDVNTDEFIEYLISMAQNYQQKSYEYMNGEFCNSLDYPKLEELINEIGYMSIDERVFNDF